MLPSFPIPYLDTTNELARNILLAVVSTLAKAERERISERTRAGLARVKRAGKKLGRPPVASKKRTQVLKLVKGGMKIRAAVRKLGISHVRVLNWQNRVVKKGVPERVGHSISSEPARRWVVSLPVLLALVSGRLQPRLR